MLKRALKALGKSDRKVIAVFACSEDEAGRMVRHVRRGAPDLPVRIYCRDAGNTASTAFRAWRELWPDWVALSVTAWTGRHHGWPLKCAPFFIPPFRILVMNEQGDFFTASPFNLVHHCGRRLINLCRWTWYRSADILHGFILWLFAFVAQRFAPLSRAVFRKQHGSAALHLESHRPEGDGIEIIRHARRLWNLEDVRNRVQNGSRRWVLFLEDDVTEPDVTAWLDLFVDSRTFAVSRQVDYQDWKPGLFPTAPFRPLQPGEVSQTFAPVSTALLVDRAKLQSLKVPKTVVPGTAWFQLFWMAAAAGWRSYSIGAGETIAEAPDWPYEEAEFVSRILSDGALRRLGPREPDLARGNVSFQPHLQQPFRGLRRVLVLSPYLPFPLSHGGAVRIFNLCRALADRVDFLLLAFREKGEAVHYQELHDVFRQVYVADIDERASEDRQLPRQVRHHQSSGVRAWIAELCSRHNVDLLQVEFTHLAHFRDAAPVPAILVEHDLTFTLYRQLAEQRHTREAYAEYERWHAFEKAALRSFDAVWTMSDADRERAVKEGSRADRTYAVANGVDLERFSPTTSPDHQEIFYIGSFRHLPNILGFKRLTDEIMPAVWAQHPGARLRVVAGPDPGKYWKEFRKEEMPDDFDPRVEMYAFVADVRPLYESASIVAVPLVISAGTNVKVMEAMACGRTVVSTTIGCAGLDLVNGWDAVIADTSEAFAGAIIALLNDPEQRLRIAAQGRRTVEHRFSWTSIAGQAYSSYLDLLRTG